MSFNDVQAGGRLLSVGVEDLALFPNETKAMELNATASRIVTGGLFYFLLNIFEFETVTRDAVSLLTTVNCSDIYRW